MAEIDVSRPFEVGIVILGVEHPGHARALSLFNASASESHIKFLPGMIGRTFLPSLDGKTIFEYVQWQSFNHLLAVRDNFYYYDHINVVAEYASRIDVAFYRLTGAWNRDESAKPITILKHENAFFAVGISKTTLEMQSGLIDALTAAWPECLDRHGAVRAMALHAGLKGDRVAVVLKLDGGGNQQGIPAIETLFNLCGNVPLHFAGVHSVAESCLAGRLEIGPIPYRILTGAG
jgi:hypothetical protein